MEKSVSPKNTNRRARPAKSFVAVPNFVLRYTGRSRPIEELQALFIIPLNTCPGLVETS